jgi:hypothetical protein
MESRIIYEAFQEITNVGLMSSKAYLKGVQILRRKGFPLFEKDQCRKFPNLLKPLDFSAIIDFG